MKVYYVLYDLSQEGYIDTYNSELFYVNYIDNLNDDKLFLSEEEAYNRLVEFKRDYDEIENSYVEIKKVYL